MDAQRLRILVVDNEGGTRAALYRGMNGAHVDLPDINLSADLELHQVSSIAAGLARVRLHHPDILLLEYKLKDGTGLDMLRQLRSEGIEVLTIFVTALITPEVTSRAMRFGAYDLLAKPFTAADLEHKLKKAVGHLLMQRQARLLEEEKRRVRFEFIRILGHELKAPLGAVEGYLGLMRDHVLGDDISAYEQTIARSQLRMEGMRKLIADLLDLTRIESGQRVRELVPLDIVSIARESIETHQPAADAKGITVEVDSPEAIEFSADRTEMEIVFNNLISNAVKYNRDGGRVSVLLRGTNDSVTIAVTDTGIGLSPSDAQRLFNDFVRIKNDFTRHIPGSGLGLSTVKKIAELYMGNVEIKSEPEVGSTFTVTLKRPETESREEPDHATQRDPALVAH